MFRPPKIRLESINTEPQSEGEIGGARMVEEYRVRVLPPTSTLGMLEEVARLLCHGRPEFQELFGTDHRARVEGGRGLLTALCGTYSYQNPGVKHCLGGVAGSHTFVCE